MTAIDEAKESELPLQTPDLRQMIIDASHQTSSIESQMVIGSVKWTSRLALP
ncbi:hypothetical protein K443DRAFT_680068 [Laccaria amethystina LaAM-08-1]|uniref:Uncharacterized protein n=1 Tax=Laccaria amethystina LaAM-08-1 TaxID=1095629 RepID=A0A0C9XCP4_9AGAR|nr:hypothetical protein K443DRAFT_680068 [Laccaria amethystina LaAM-08-1]